MHEDLLGLEEIMMKAEEKFSPGLDGIVAAETKISFLDTVKGEIVIQGYDLIELSKQKSI